MIPNLAYEPADIGPALILALVWGTVGRWAKLSAGWKLSGYAALCLAIAVPLGGVTLAGHILAYTGDLSVVTLCLLADHITTSELGLSLISAPSRNAIKVWSAFAGLVLFPMGLGFGPFDPYALGFQPVTLALFAVAMAVVFWIAELRGAGAAILIAVALYHLRPLDSTNLWDYLLDPWICLTGLLFVAQAGLRQCSARRRVA